MTKRLHIEIRVDDGGPQTSEVEITEERETWARAADAAGDAVEAACEAAFAEPEEKVP